MRTLYHNEKTNQFAIDLELEGFKKVDNPIEFIKFKDYGPPWNDPEFHRNNGRQEGFPECCIDNFIDLWQQCLPPALYMELISKDIEPKINFVRCHTCRLTPMDNEEFLTNREIYGVYS